MGNQKEEQTNKMNTKVFAVGALLCASIYGLAPNGVSKITFKRRDFEWSEQEQTYLNKRGKSVDNLKIEDYARPELGDYDEESGLLRIDIKKFLKDVNRKLKKANELLKD